MMLRFAVAVMLVVVRPTGGFSQSTSPRHAFEVASVRVHEGPMPRIGVSTSGSRLNGEGETAVGLMIYAFDPKNYQILRTPEVMHEVRDTFFDVVAKAEGDAAPPTAEFRRMMQSLLAERFKLAYHREMREMPVYALVAAKNGPKLKQSVQDANETWNVAVIGRNYSVTMGKAAMSDFIDMLDESGFIDRPVINRTGLTGTYDIKVTYTPELRSNRAEPDPNDISIFTALQNQLGLKLESQKAMVEILVVDHVERPSGN